MKVQTQNFRYASKRLGSHVTRPIGYQSTIKKNEKKKGMIRNSAVSGLHLLGKFLFHHLRQFILLNMMTIIPVLLGEKLRIVG